VPRLLLELGCEELPAGACREAQVQLPALARRHLGADPDRLYIGPRRVAFVIDELPERAPDEERRGPAERIAFDEEGRPTRAAEGFARGAGVTVDELERRGGHVWASVPGASIVESLPGRLDDVVRGLAFSKSMRWDDSGLRFARPVRWRLAKLDSATLVGQTSFGHRFSHGAVEIATAGEYAERLRAAGVEPDAAERRRAIVAGLDELGGWSDPHGVLEEVVHLVESPIVVEGRFDERFLQLPERVVVTAMQSHQRYFPLGGNRFAFVANGGDIDTVRAGNELVLEGRLDDASFTFERDAAVGIEALAARLGSITFFAGAGTYADKTERLLRLVERLGGGEASREAVRLAKADQASELVREFPDLEGYIGGQYARLAGFPEAVCAAIEEHYLPDEHGGPLPRTDAGKIVAAADKLDTLTVSFELGHRPTGSRDPYALRRAAIGLSRLAVEGGLAIDVRALAPPEVAEFVEERLEGLLDVPVDYVRAARASAVSELGAIADLARTLYRERESDSFVGAYTAYDRANRLAGRAEAEAAPSLDAGLLTEDAERALAEQLARTALPADDVGAALRSAAELAPLVDRLFDEVLVMADDPAVRANRLRLLLDVRDTVGQLGDLSQIPV
jgi:glycyl-tRNA synthetase beta chain